MFTTRMFHVVGNMWSGRQFSVIIVFAHAQNVHHPDVPRGGEHVVWQAVFSYNCLCACAECSPPGCSTWSGTRGVSCLAGGSASAPRPAWTGSTISVSRVPICRAGHATSLYRDNVSMFSGQRIVYFCIMSMFVVATPLRRLNIFRIFAFTEALARCRVVVVSKLKNCHLPSSAGTLKCGIYKSYHVSMRCLLL